jgi:hypothetical protein
VRWCNAATPSPDRLIAESASSLRVSPSENRRSAARISVIATGQPQPVQPDRRIAARGQYDRGVVGQLGDESFELAECVRRTELVEIVDQQDERFGVIGDL